MHYPLKSIRTIAEETIEIILDASSSPLSFEPGQYIRLTFPGLKFPDPKGNSREFSIVSAPYRNHELVIAFRNSESGFKRSVFASRVGEIFDVQGPYGFFTLPQKSKQPHIFVAGGIGITPFMSMAEHAAEHSLPHEIFLIYANQSAERTAYRDFLSGLEDKNPNFKVRHHIGILTSQAIREYTEGIREPQWYIAGPPRMTSDIKQALLNAGADKDNIFFEEFIGYE